MRTLTTLSMRSAALAAALAVSGFALPGATAWAGEVEEAEHQRLYEEMKRLSARNAWPGVERAFQNLEDLKGEEPTFDDLYLGAVAARNLGKMGDCRDRLARAAALEANEEVIGLLTEVDAAYGPVELSAHKDVEDLSLAPAAMPFAADQRKSIERAQKIVGEERAYADLLPAGEYTFGDQAFTVVAGPEGEPVVSELGPPPSERPDLVVWVGGDLGGSFTAALEPSGDTSLQPLSSFSGAGIRVGPRVEAQMGRFGGFLGLGYHGLYSAAAAEAPPEYAVYGNRMHLGFASLGGTARLQEDFRLSLGGILSRGVSQATGLLSCEGDALEVEGCATDDNLDGTWVPWKGRLTMPGVQASAGYAFLEIGGAGELVGTATGGALFDPERAYPWGQVGLTFNAAINRSE